MRAAFLFAAVTLAAVASPAPAAPPVVTFQVEPTGRLLADLRAGARIVGGESAVGELDRAIERTLGGRDLPGVALDRPAVGYFVLGSKDGGTTVESVVLAVPVTGEPEFLALCRRAGRAADPVEGRPGLYRLARPAAKPGDHPTHLRFHEGHAYLVQGLDPAAADPAELAPPGGLAAADEPGLVAVRVHFDRLSAETRGEAMKAIGQAAEALKGLPVPDAAAGPAGRALGQFQAAAGRWLGQLADIRSGVGRLTLDLGAGEAGLEFALVPKPETDLARDVAARVAAPSRFAGLVGKDAAVGVSAASALPGGVGEVLGAVLEEAAKADLGRDLSPAARPVLAELVRAFGRAYRSGEFGWALAVSGPDAAGRFGLVAGVSADDTAKLEQAFRGLVAEGLPPDTEYSVQLDAAKAGGANVHLLKFKPAAAGEAAEVFGPDARGALAFGPKGIYFAFGQDPVGAAGAAVGLGLRPARSFDVSVNPARLAKLAGAADGPESAKSVTDAVGSSDETASALFVALEGGRELRLRVGASLKLLGKPAYRAKPPAGP